MQRLGDARDTPTVTSRGPRQAHLEGFDLHANVWVSAHDRAGLERLSRYIRRPPFAQEWLRRRSDGRIALELKTPWLDGTRELVFELLELLERLAAMTPRPETKLLKCSNCGGGLRLIATLHDPAMIRKLLAHLGMARSGPSPGPARVSQRRALI